jgi:PKD repeat protein
MKQKLFFYAAGIVLIILSACKKPPTASFNHSSDSYEAYDTVNFTSTSEDADNFRWDFGDGSTSTIENPWHIYNVDSSYEVELEAINDDGSNKATKSVVIKEPTILAFWVIEDESEEILSDCEVYVWDNEVDFSNYNWQSVVGAGYTDADGYIDFYHPKAIVYYLIAYKEETGGAWYFEGYTGAIILNELNEYLVRAMWFPDEKKSTIHHTKTLKLLEKIN